MSSGESSVTWIYEDIGQIQPLEFIHVSLKCIEWFRVKMEESGLPSSIQFVWKEGSCRNNIQTGIASILLELVPSNDHLHWIEETETIDATRERTRPWLDTSVQKEPLLQLEKVPALAVNEKAAPIHSVGVSSCTLPSVAFLLNHRNCSGKQIDVWQHPCESVSDWASDKNYSTESPCPARANQHVDRCSSTWVAWEEIRS